MYIIMIIMRLSDPGWEPGHLVVQLPGPGCAGAFTSMNWFSHLKSDVKKAKVLRMGDPRAGNRNTLRPYFQALGHSCAILEYTKLNRI